ncbi:hypothetical protein J4461_01995 [Candidatus Pacearchaeota archaeon]|nr:hypothetical protein [Candidatus Pacearchaeota archaeon]
MELNKYLNKRVQIILGNGFTYIGLVIATDDNSITLIDKTNSKVCIKESSIDFIKEVNR